LLLAVVPAICKEPEVIVIVPVTSPSSAVLTVELTVTVPPIASAALPPEATSLLDLTLL
jgi:hypothetical protein